MKRRAWYSHFAKSAARAAGRPGAFIVAALLIAITGPLFRFSEAWQVVIQTITAVATFLMVFLIQNTQNRDTEAIQIKLDELIRATDGAHLALLDLEELDDKQLDEFRRRYERLAMKARRELREGRPDTHNAEV